MSNFEEDFSCGRGIPLADQRPCRKTVSFNLQPHHMNSVSQKNFSVRSDSKVDAKDTNRKSKGRRVLINDTPKNITNLKVDRLKKIVGQKDCQASYQNAFRSMTSETDSRLNRTLFRFIFKNLINKYSSDCDGSFEKQVQNSEKALGSALPCVLLKRELCMIPLSFRNNELESEYKNHSSDRSFAFSIFSGCVVLTFTYFIIVGLLIFAFVGTSHESAYPTELFICYMMVWTFSFLCWSSFWVFPWIGWFRSCTEVHVLVVSALSTISLLFTRTLVELKFHNLFVYNYKREQIHSAVDRNTVFYFALFNLLVLDILSSVRVKASWIVHAAILISEIVPIIVSAVVHGTQTSYNINNTLTLILYTSVILLMFIGRYRIECRDRMIYFQAQLNQFRLSEAEEELNQFRVSKTSSPVEDILSFLKQAKRITNVMIDNKTDSCGNVEEAHKLNNILNLFECILTKNENLYSLKRGYLTQEQLNYLKLYDIKMRQSSGSFSDKVKGSESKINDSEDKKIPNGDPRRRTIKCDALPTSPGSKSVLKIRTASEDSPTCSRNEVFNDNLPEDALKKHLINILTRPPSQCSMYEELEFAVRHDWDSFSYIRIACQTANVLLEIGYALLRRLACSIDCSEITLQQFLFAIQNQYPNNHYHNQVHGAMVAHAIWFFIETIGLSSMFTGFESVSILVAAISHDVGHPGRNNAYFVNTFDDIAIMYNDFSVLENFHSCLLFRTLTIPECNVLSSAPDADFRECRQQMIELILATDMTQHFESITKFKVRRGSPEFCPATDPEDRWRTCRMCMKAADLGHGVVSWEDHLIWSTKLVNEFYEQGDEEMLMGIECSSLFDRRQHKAMCKSQSGFLEFVVLPLYNELATIDYSGTIGELVAQIESNKDQWSILSDEGHIVPLDADKTFHYKVPRAVAKKYTTSPPFARLSHDIYEQQLRVLNKLEFIHKNSSDENMSP